MGGRIENRYIYIYIRLVRMIIMMMMMVMMKAQLLTSLLIVGSVFIVVAVN